MLEKAVNTSRDTRLAFGCQHLLLWCFHQCRPCRFALHGCMKHNPREALCFTRKEKSLRAAKVKTELWTFSTSFPCEHAPVRHCLGTGFQPRVCGRMLRKSHTTLQWLSFTTGSAQLIAKIQDTLLVSSLYNDEENSRPDQVMTLQSEILMNVTWIPNSPFDKQKSLLR